MADKISKIKLIQIIADAGLGGGPRHVLGLIKNVDKEKFDVYVVCPSGYLSAEAKLVPGISVFNLAMSSKFDLISVYKLRRIIGKIRAESKDPFGSLIVHMHGPRAGLIGRMAVPAKAKTVYTEHRLDEDYHLKNPINEWVQKRMMRGQNFDTDLIIAVSSAVKNYLLSADLAPKGRVRVIPNGIELKKADNPTSLKLRGAGRIQITAGSKSTKAPVIGTIGNLNFQKGQTYLIEAMAMVVKKFPLATLEIIGEGEERSALEADIKRFGIERHVSLLGQKHDVERYLRHWSVFALPSVAETFGIVILEAMQAGVPVVTTKVGGVPDVIANNKNGILISPRNSDQLAKEILNVLEHPALAAKLKRGGLDRVKDFDWKKIIPQIEESYFEVLGLPK